MGKPLTDDQIRAQIAEARGRGARAQLTEPHAAAARYDWDTRRLEIELTNGASFSVPVALVPGLEGATESHLGKVEVSPAGVGLHWPDLDADLSVAGLARLMFGGRTLARAAGAVAGSVRSDAKAAAARSNGARGGRPRRAPTTVVGVPDAEVVVTWAHEKRDVGTPVAHEAATGA